MEACRIELMMNELGAVNVQAPMRYKPLCYDILEQARCVINQTPHHLFSDRANALAIVMDMAGRVDVSAPLPQLELCYAMLDTAKTVIERYEDETAVNPLLGS